MGDLTKNLSRYEYACKCGCGFDTIDYVLVKRTQDYADFLAEKYNSKIIVEIKSGNRCRKHNESEQKKVNPKYIPFSSESQHLFARGEDVKFYYFKDGEKTQVPPKEVHEYFDNKYSDMGLGLYHNRNHLDTRGYRAIWGI